MSSLRLEGGLVLSMEPGTAPVPAGTVVIEGEKIAYAGAAAGAPDSPGAEVLDCTGSVVLPGLVNAHTHVAMTLLRGFADDMPLQPWLEEKIWPTEMKLTPEDVYWGALLGVGEMLRGGVTCCNDMYHFFREGTRAAVDGGMRFCPSGVLLGFLPNAGDVLEEARDFVLESRELPRVHPMLGPHAPYTCPDPLLARVVEYAAELGAPIHIHVSETAKEVADSVAEFGETPVARLARLGILDQQVLAAHCVHLTPADRALLAEKGAGIAHCPTSNLKLASGFAPVAELLAEGAIVGLGTDGCASNNNLDMFEEMLLAALVSKGVTGDPTAIPAEQALALATREAARALGLGDLIGTLTPGKRADVIVVDCRRPHLQPLHNVVSQLVYAAHASDVTLTIVDGEILYRDGKLTRIDEAEVIARAGAAATRLTA
jgi:5-methylthioadenosine/S-adenosylhomocysteine deaminase